MLCPNGRMVIVIIPAIPPIIITGLYFNQSVSKNIITNKLKFEYVATGNISWFI